jgi:GDP-4-dehydro-6-deoxy-D-mannose reductase
MRVLITGINGFAGRHLHHLFDVQGATVFGTVHPHEGILPDRSSRFFAVDIRSEGALRGVVRRCVPDVVFHLAAQAFVPAAKREPRRTFEVNVGGAINLLDAVRRESPRTKVILISSSDVYGRVAEDEVPIGEDHRIAPASVYAASKTAMEHVGRIYAADFNLSIVILRPFSHIGPGQKPLFVCSDFARQIALIERGRQEPVVQVGDIDTRRDFTDVRDMARAYVCAGKKAAAGECYNVSSGKARSIRELVELLRRYARVPVEIVRDERRLRKSEIPILVGDSGKFRAATGWSPGIAFEKTVADTLAWWRERV